MCVPPSCVAQGRMTARGGGEKQWGDREEREAEGVSLGRLPLVLLAEHSGRQGLLTDNPVNNPLNNLGHSVYQ